MTDIIIRAGELTPYWPRGRDVSSIAGRNLFSLLTDSVTPNGRKCKV